ncbi:MAG: hypothetical protein PHN74_03020 [Candidatus Pacebacteria bacterium]|nr:hypothetical protein [Candidatus Paceibacterota bacterium]
MKNNPRKNLKNIPVQRSWDLASRMEYRSARVSNKKSKSGGKK